MNARPLAFQYLDDCRHPEAEQVLWEVEATAKILGATSLPSVDANNPDHPAALRSFVNAHRWTRLNRLRESNDIRDEPLLGVWNSAIEGRHQRAFAAQAVHLLDAHQTIALLPVRLRLRRI